MDYLEQRRKLRQMVQERLDYGRDYTDEEVEDTIDEVLMEQESLELCPVELRRRLRKELFDSLRRLDILQIFVEDSSVTEIMINGMDHIFVEQDGQLRELDRAFDSMEKLQDVIQQIVAGCNRVVNEASPIVDARLNNGSRVNIVMNPIALNGPIVTIRRFPDKPITMQKLIGLDTISLEAAEFLETLVKAGYNIFVSGGTGSGKTTFLNVLSGYISAEERVITIEDSAELQLQGLSNLVRLETRNGNAEGCREIGIRCGCVRTGSQAYLPLAPYNLSIYAVSHYCKVAHVETLDFTARSGYFVHFNTNPTKRWSLIFSTIQIRN